MRLRDIIYSWIFEFSIIFMLDYLSRALILRQFYYDVLSFGLLRAVSLQLIGKRLTVIADYVGPVWYVFCRDLCLFKNLLWA